MILCQFVFEPGEYDDDFHTLDRQIAAYAESLPGFVGVETWHSSDLRIVNACYYFRDHSAVRDLSGFSGHLAAKEQYERWYRGYRIIVSEVTASYGDDRMPHLTET